MQIQDKVEQLRIEHQSMKTEKKVHQLQQDVDQSDETSHRLDFSDKVINILGKRAAFRPKKETECPKCSKQFDLPWKLKRHMSDCRIPGANYIKK